MLKYPQFSAFTGYRDSIIMYIDFLKKKSKKYNVFWIFKGYFFLYR